MYAQIIRLSLECAFLYLCEPNRNRSVPKEFRYVFVGSIVSWSLDLYNWLLMQPTFREITVEIIMDASHRSNTARILIDSSCGC